ncbi:hypothetical protein GN956_G3142 [Arapaima gigas]
MSNFWGRLILLLLQCADCFGGAEAAGTVNTVNEVNGQPRTPAVLQSSSLSLKCTQCSPALLPRTPLTRAFLCAARLSGR